MESATTSSGPQHHDSAFQRINQTVLVFGSDWQTGEFGLGRKSKSNLGESHRLVDHGEIVE